MVECNVRGERDTEAEKMHRIKKITFLGQQTLVGQPLLRRSARSKCLHNNTEIVFAFFTVLTFTQTMQKNSGSNCRCLTGSKGNVTNIPNRKSLFFTTTYSMSKNTCHLTPVLDEMVESLVLLNPNPWVRAILIFCVANWKGCTRHVCCLLKYEGFLKENHCVNDLWEALTTFHGRLFLLERKTGRQCCY